MQNDNNSDLPKKGVTPPLARLERVKRWLIRALPAFGVGLVAGLCCAVCMLILRLAAGIPTPVELFGDFVLKRLDTGTFVHMLSIFKANPKLIPLGLTLLGMLGLGGVLGLLYQMLVRLQPPVAGWRPERREWLTMLALVLLLTVI